MVNYGSPKEYQITRNNSIGHNPNSHPGIKKWPCKRLKGEHKYGEWEEVRYDWAKEKSTGYYLRLCIGCGTKEHWFAPLLPGIHYERDLTARPPGYKE